VLWLVDPCRNRPHPHQIGWERSHQVTRVGLLAKPAGIIIRCQNHRHAVMNVDHQLVGIGGDNCKGPNPFALSRFLPVLPAVGNDTRSAILHSDSVGLLCPLTLDRPTLEEAIYWYNAAALTVRIAECRQVPHGLVLGVDRLSTTHWVLAPIRDQAPAQWVERYLAGLVIAADHHQFLARRAIPPGWIIVHVTVADVHAINDGIPKWPAALDNSPAHRLDIVIRQRVPTHGPLHASGSPRAWDRSEDEPTR